MLKKYKKTLILTSVLILMPMLVGFLLWDRLPAEMATHFNAQGEADGWSSKLFAVAGLPFFLLAVHWICFWGTSNDPKREKISDKVFGLVLWVCPIVSIMMMGATYMYSLGMPVDITMIGKLFCAVVFLVVGNYLPKSRQNYTVGIKIPWTLADENNWNRTHRFGGKMFMAMGLVFFLDIFLKTNWLIVVAMILAAVVPMVYSFAIFKGWI